MTTLTRAWRWERFAPDIGENLSLPEADRLHLLVASGLSAARLQQHRDAYDDAASDSSSSAALVAGFSRVFDGLVRVDGTHTIDGKKVETLEQYLEVVVESSGVYNLSELGRVVVEFNSVQGTQQLFWRRHAGGLLSTRAQNAVKDSAPTGGR